MMQSDSKIGTQVKLPFSVAFEVVTQGIRIRLGRAIVTMMGIVLGIAFLMSILAGEVIKQGVAQEEQLRNDVRRMANFLAAEVGPPQGRRFAVVVTGRLSDTELRLIARLHDSGAESIKYVIADANVPAPQDMQGIAQKASLTDVAESANAVVVAGDGSAAGIDLAGLLAGAKNKVVAFTRETNGAATAAGFTTVLLSRQPTEREQQKLAQSKRSGAFRRGWIVVISLLASVISISNAMLMSVTERFREIGTMKCLGAMSSFIRRMFLIESSLMGMAGSVTGAVAGLVFVLAVYGITYGFGTVLGSLQAGPILINVAICLGVGMVLSVLAALYPARMASRMLPAHALRTNV